MCSRSNWSLEVMVLVGRKTGEPGEKHWDSEGTPSLGVPTNRVNYVLYVFSIYM